MHLCSQADRKYGNNNMGDHRPSSDDELASGTKGQSIEASVVVKGYPGQSSLGVIEVT